ncbi:MAG: hypothetical protein ACLU99_04570 [Alphaproteobacteria bacterium]
MKKMSFILILTFLLFACATPAKYDSKLNRLVGVSKSQLIKDMGQPSATKVFANGDEVLAYVKANDVYVPSEFYLYNQGHCLTNMTGFIRLSSEIMIFRPTEPLSVMR